MKSLTLFFVLVALQLSSANASEHIEKMCAKIKQCALSHVASDEIPEQMKAMVVQVIDSQCTAMASRYDVIFEEAGLQDKAKACVDSIVEQRCDDLLSDKGSPDTPACAEFEAAANEANIDLK